MSNRHNDRGRSNNNNNQNNNNQNNHNSGNNNQTRKRKDREERSRSRHERNSNAKRNCRTQIRGGHYNNNFGQQRGRGHRGRGHGGFRQYQSSSSKSSSRPSKTSLDILAGDWSDFLTDTHSIDSFKKESLKYPHKIMTLFTNSKKIDTDPVDNTLTEDEEIRHVFFWFKYSWWNANQMVDKNDEHLTATVKEIQATVEKCQKKWKPVRIFLIIENNSNFFSFQCALANQLDFIDIKLNPVGKSKLNEIQNFQDRFKCFKSRVRKVVDTHHSTNKSLENNSPNRVYRY